MSEKKICEVTIRCSEELKNAVNDVALYEDRKASDIWRVAAELYIFGHKHRADIACGHLESRGTLRGNQS